jgi:signal peptidase I
MKLSLSDEPITIELLAESLQRTGSAVITINGTSMHPTLQMGWRVYLRPATGDDVRVGEIAVFRGERYLTVHRLVFRHRTRDRVRLVFRGDYNRVREWVDPASVIARVVAIEVPGLEKDAARVVALEPDVLTRFYQLAQIFAPLARSILPRDDAEAGQAPPGLPGRLARSLVRGTERLLTLFLPERR